MTDDEIRQCEEYFTECSPTIVDVETIYEAEGEYSINYIYRCEGCEYKNCEYWEKYN